MSEKTISVNSISGGQSSAYLMQHFPADYNVFTLIRINAPKAAPKDPWVKKYVQDKLGVDFVATAEDDAIFYTLADLEQFTGQEIHWVKNPTFEEVMKSNGLPNKHRRFCTQLMKVQPIAQWCWDTFGEPVEMRLGFRANEARRVEAKMDRANLEGFNETEVVVGHYKGGRRKWSKVPFARYTFPLYQNQVFNDMIRAYWKDKPVRFAERNNCVGCFHRNPILLNLMSKKFPEKYQWFVDTENAARKRVNKQGKQTTWITWRQDGQYEDFAKHNTQLTMDDLDGFVDCDEGYCGL